MKNLEDRLSKNTVLQKRNIKVWKEKDKLKDH